MDASHLAGYSRIGLFFGVTVAAVGAYVGLEPFAWVGVVAVAVSFAGNLLAKIRHYANLDVSPAARTRVVATWGALAVSAILFVAVAVAVQFGAPYGRYFWALGVSTLLLLVVHRVVRAASIPPDAEG